MIGQVFLTVFSGVLVFALGQVFVKFVIDPIQALYKVIGEVGHALIYYANRYSNTQVCLKSEMMEAHEAFRRLSGQLFLHAHVVPWYGVWATLRFLPPHGDVQKAGGQLIGLSNGCLDQSDMAAEHNDTRRRNLERLLRLKTGG